MATVPCPICGYDARSEPCPHCNVRPRAPDEPSLRGGPIGRVSGTVAGVRAMFQGMVLLFGTPGLKRFLVPPLLLTLLGFAALFGWLWELLGSVFDLVAHGRAQDLDWPEGWWRDAAIWVLESHALVLLAGAGQLVFFLISIWFLIGWTFSIVYEAIAGPFLDEMHARLEERWFGHDPRATIERPTRLPVRICARRSLIASIPALGALVGWWIAAPPVSWIALALSPLPFAVSALLDREYGRWLGWVIKVESRTLWVSIKAAMLSGLILLLFLWVKLVPVVGPALFLALAGFVTSISLLDIPFSRRQWSLRQRMRFMSTYAGAVTAFGVVAGLVFMLPVIGPLIMVPSASLGGLWLLCRLDKSPLRSDAGPAT